MEKTLYTVVFSHTKPEKKRGKNMRKNVKLTVLFVLMSVLLIQTAAYAGEVLVTVNAPIATYFARVQENPIYQIQNKASVAFGEKLILGTEYEHLPVISRTSVISGGFRGADDFVHIPAGDYTMEQIETIYYYNNHLEALKLNGQQIIDWMEASGGNFYQIDPNSTEDQFLINYGFDGHHLDHFWGVTYMYDVTKPVGERVVNPQFKGEPLTEDMEFIVMVDSYRASGGGDLPHAVPENVVLSSDLDFRTLLLDYLVDLGGVMPELETNWSIMPIETKGNILVKTGNEWGMPVMEYMEEAAATGVEPVDHLEYYGTDGVWGVFTIDLSKIQTP